jgi:hypothetical protein
MELHHPPSRATVVYCDNLSAMYLSSNPVQHQRTKHVEIDLHFVRDRVALGEARVLHVPTSCQYADIFTKGLPTSVFEEFRTSLNVLTGAVPTGGAVEIPSCVCLCNGHLYLYLLFPWHCPIVRIVVLVVRLSSGPTIPLQTLYVPVT